MNRTYFRECFKLWRVLPFFEVSPEADLQKELAEESREALYDNSAGTLADTLLAQFEEDE